MNQDELLKRADKIGETITQLAAEMRVPAERIFDALCLAEQINGWWGLSLTCVVLGFCALVTVRVGRTLEADATEVTFGILIAAAVIGLLSATILLECGGDWVTQIVAPEVGAIERVLKAVK